MSKTNRGLRQSTQRDSRRFTGLRGKPAVQPMMPSRPARTLTIPFLLLALLVASTSLLSASVEAPPPRRVARAAPPPPPPPAEPAPAPPTQVFVYPTGGQTEERLGRDRYECHLWAEKQSNFDL